mgnify:FL=1
MWKIKDGDLSGSILSHHLHSINRYMYIPLEYLFAITTTVVAYAAYHLGKKDDADFRDDVVNSTIDYLIQENMVKWKRHSDGEIELFPLDEK